MEQDEGLSPVATVARRVKEVRGRKGMTAKELADKLRDDAGVKWDRATVTKLETGHRQTLTVVELLALARVLDVAPTHLLVPLDDRPFQVTPKEVQESGRVRQWLRGEKHLPGTDLQVFYSEVPLAEMRQVVELQPAVMTEEARSFVAVARAQYKAKTGLDLDDDATLNWMLRGERPKGLDDDGEHQEEAER
jgi:transcriptional regulator with XRE-family HTH domain